MKKAAVIVLCLLMVLSFALPTSALSSTPSSKSGGASEAPLVIKHFYDYSWFSDNYTNTSIGKALEEKCNVDLQITHSPTDDDQKLNIMIATNDLPDLITLDKTNVNISKMVKGGLVYSVTDLVNKYAPGMNKTLDPAILTLFKQADGKQYFFPSFVVTQNFLKIQNASGMWQGAGNAPISVMRSDVYNAIGKPDMSTPDNFFKALKAAKAKFPKLTPWYFGPYVKDNNLFKATEWLGNLSPAETMFGLTLYEVKNGKVQSGVRDPKFLDFIKYMNKLYTNGLIDPNSFVDADNIAKAKIAKGNYSVMTYNGNSFPDKAKIQDNPNATWVPVPYFKGGKHIKDGSGWTATLFTKKIADPARLMKFVEFCSSDVGSQLIDWGVQGKDWEYKTVGGQKVVRWIGEYADMWQTDWSKFEKTSGATTYFAFDNFPGHNFTAAKAPSELTAYDKKLQAVSNPTTYIYDPKLSLINPNGSAPEGIIQAKLMQLADTYYPKMVLAKDQATVVKYYNEFIQKSNSMGLAKLEAAWTKQYSLMK